MSDITVAAKGADITLSGSIRGKREAFRAAAVASSVRGVRVVHNELFGW
jgi:osmotically-inducible protein OsmY